jgi:AraC family transcriptional regulator, transcriptional activator FtrA
MGRKRKRDVAVLAYDGLGIFEFAIAAEIFGLPRPELGRDWYQFRVCSLGSGPLRATGGVSVRATHGLAGLSRAGTIIIPGWIGYDVPPPLRLISSLRKAHASGARLVSICSGVFVLAATGLLNGRKATTHWRYVQALRSKYPDIQVEPNVLYVDEGRILTSAGSAAGIDLCLHIVRQDFGAEIANQVARRLVVPPHREGGQAQFIQEPLRKTTNGGLAPTLRWLESNLNRELSIGDLARRAAMSPRTFARQFRRQTGTTPHQWLTHLRLLAAQRRLEQTHESIDEVAEAVGWQTAATMRLHFMRHLRTSPTAYRRRFSTVPDRRNSMSATAWNVDSRTSQTSW